MRIEALSNPYGDAKPGEFLPGLILPPAIHAQLRKRILEIAVADSPVNCLIAQARAESLVEGLELLKAVAASAVERLYLVIDQEATQRLEELSRDSAC